MYTIVVPSRARPESVKTLKLRLGPDVAPFVHESEAAAYRNAGADRVETHTVVGSMSLIRYLGPSGNSTRKKNGPRE